MVKHDKNDQTSSNVLTHAHTCSNMLKHDQTHQNPIMPNKIRSIRSILLPQIPLIKPDQTGYQKKLLIFVGCTCCHKDNCQRKPLIKPDQMKSNQVTPDQTQQDQIRQNNITWTKITNSNTGFWLYLLSQGQLPKDTAEMSFTELLSEWLTPDLETNSQITLRQTTKKAKSPKVKLQEKSKTTEKKKKQGQPLDKLSLNKKLPRVMIYITFFSVK